MKKFSQREKKRANENATPKKNEIDSEMTPDEKEKQDVTSVEPNQVTTEAKPAEKKGKFNKYI